MGIVVVGGGPAGATVARLLALRGLPVTVIDPGPCRTGRLEVLAPASSGVLDALALHEFLTDASIAVPCAGIRRRWTSSKTEFDDFFRHLGGQAFVVDRNRFDRLLFDLCIAAGAKHMIGRVTAIRRTPEGFELDVAEKSGSVLVAADLVVDATGRPAAVARRLGAGRLFAQRLVAERCSQEIRQWGLDACHWLDVEAREKSWTYAITGPGGRYESWIVHSGGRRLANVSQVNASSACLGSAAGGGWIAVGDAAAAFDPVTSQGLLNALSSAMVAAGAIVSAGTITTEVAKIYAEAMLLTFSNSERGRVAVYRAMRAA